MRCGGMDGSFAPRLEAGSPEAAWTTALADLWKEAQQFDCDGADPRALCRPLVECNLFAGVCGPTADSGVCSDAARLHKVLIEIGAANLSAARIFEGHVNAVKLVRRYGSPTQAATLARQVEAGAICGVWNAEGGDGLKLAPADSGGGCLSGGKIFASGIGFVTAPLATARLPDGSVQLVLTGAPTTTDLSGWTARGMRATATGAVGFAGVEVGPEALVGAPGDYYRSPVFKGGAWRFATAQAGAVLRTLELLQGGLALRGRDADAHQRARFGAAVLAAHTAQLWSQQAAAMETDPQVEPAQMDAFAGLTRMAVEKAALEVIGLAERSLGLSGFLRPDPLDRVIRDLATYLRQPFPDAVLDEAAAYVGGRGGRPPWSALAETTR